MFQALIAIFTLDSVIAIWGEGKTSTDDVALVAERLEMSGVRISKNIFIFDPPFNKYDDFSGHNIRYDVLKSNHTYHLIKFRAIWNNDFWLNFIGNWGVNFKMPIGTASLIHPEVGIAIYSRSLPAISVKNYYISYFTSFISYNFDTSNIYIGPKLSFCRTFGVCDLSICGVRVAFGDSECLSCVRCAFNRASSRARISLLGDQIAATRLLQRTLCLQQRPSDEAHANRTDRSSSDRPVSRTPSFMRGFFSSDSRAPLGAQIGSVVVLGMIAGIGIVLGVGPVGRLRRFGWRGSGRGRSSVMLIGFFSLALLGWLAGSS